MAGGTAGTLWIKIMVAGGIAVAAAMGIAEKTGFGGRRADATTFTDDSPD